MKNDYSTKENLITPTNKLKDMTLIIGARCKDGVVIIGDKKVTEGTTSFSDKK